MKRKAAKGRKYINMYNIYEEKFFTDTGRQSAGTRSGPSIAVMADIHGNDTALEHCLADARERGADGFLFLGDYAGELAHPERVMSLLYRTAEQYPCLFIRGNKENYWLNYRKNGEQGWKERDSVTGCMLYSYRRLTQRDLDFFSQLDPVRKVEISGLPPILACHGSPKRVNQKLLPGDPETLALMEESSCSLILCAHTHVQRKITHRGVTVLNPGSVGIPSFPGQHPFFAPEEKPEPAAPQHGREPHPVSEKGLAQYLILHARPVSAHAAVSAQSAAAWEAAAWEEEMITLEYDARCVFEELHATGLYENAPVWCRITEALFQGFPLTHGSVLARAMELCVQKTGSCSWPDIPEAFLEQALEETCASATLRHGGQIVKCAR